MKVCIRLRKITFRQSYHRFACDFPQIRVGHVLAPLRAAGGLFLSGLPILCIIDNIVNKLDGFCACRSEEHTSELQSLMRISYAVFCLKKKKTYKKCRSQNIQRNKDQPLSTCL